MTVGRPETIDDEKLELLRQAFLLGCTDREACLYAKIAPSTLYSYQERHAEFLEQKELWKCEPILRARRTVVNRLDRDAETAKWYLERKSKREFSTKLQPDDLADDTVTAIKIEIVRNKDEPAGAIDREPVKAA